MNLTTRTLLLLGLTAILVSVPAVGRAEDDDELPPEAKKALEAARKNSEKNGVKMPDVSAMLKEAGTEDSDEDADDASKPKVADTKPSPLKALPDWIPALPGFRPAETGTHQVKDGKEQGTLRGEAPGKPRDIATAYAAAAKSKFRGVTTNDITINGNLTMIVFLSAWKEEDSDDHHVEVEISPGENGKSKVTFEFKAPPPAIK